MLIINSYIVPSNKFKSFVTKEKIKINFRFGCNSSNAILCQVSSLQYTACLYLIVTNLMLVYAVTVFEE